MRGVKGLRRWFAPALVLALAVGALGLWQRQRLEDLRRAERREVLLAWLRGPAVDLAEGLGRLKPLLRKPRLSRAEKAAAAQAAFLLRRAQGSAQALRERLRGDPGQAALADAEAWLFQLADLFEPWESLKAKGLHDEALALEPVLRQKLAQRLRSQKAVLEQDKVWARSEQEEAESLIQRLAAH